MRTTDTTHNANNLPIHVETYLSFGESRARGRDWFVVVVEYPEDGFRETRVLGGSVDYDRARKMGAEWVLRNADWLVDAA